jgi:hypothetical protein
MHRFAVRLVFHEMSLMTALTGGQESQHQPYPEDAAQRILQLVHSQ